MLVTYLAATGKRRDGWEPVEGVDLMPPIKASQSPFAVWWRWMFAREKSRENSQA